MEQLAKNSVSGIFVTEHPISNMTLQRIVVSLPATLQILELIKLPLKDQEEAVDDLVRRTPNWKELETEEQVEKIKTVLTIETTIYYLECIETIRPQVDVIETGIDDEGSIVVEAYYTNMSREQRRAAEKAMSENDKEALVAAVAQIDQLMEKGNVLDLAKKRMEKMAQEKKGKRKGKK
jgi:hypothetical protein